MYIYICVYDCLCICRLYRLYIYMILYRFIDVGLWELLSTFAVGCHVHVRLPVNVQYWKMYVFNVSPGLTHLGGSIGAVQLEWYPPPS